MGIYLFNRDTLIEALEKTDYRDFGKEVFPASIRSKKVFVHLFDGYWEDIGTIKSFFRGESGFGLDAFAVLNWCPRRRRSIPERDFTPLAGSMGRPLKTALSPMDR